LTVQTSGMIYDVMRRCGAGGITDANRAGKTLEGPLQIKV
jgi:hypothetical protein